MPPTPLDGKPLPLDSPTDRRRVLRRLADGPGQPVLRQGAGQPRLAQLPGPRPGRGRGRPARDQPADQRANCSTPWRRTSSTHKYDVKHLIRTIMNSAAYQRSSKPLPGNAADDRFYSHYLIRRLPAEVILDAYSQVTGVPTPFNAVSIGRRAAARTARPATRRARGRCSCRTRWWCRGSSTPSAGRSAWQTCSCERHAGLERRPGAAPEQRQDAQRQAPGPKGSRRVAVAGRPVRRTPRSSSECSWPALARTPTAAEERLEAAWPCREGGGASREALEDLVWAVLTGKEFLFNH